MGAFEGGKRNMAVEFLLARTREPYFNVYTCVVLYRGWLQIRNVFIHRGGTNHLILVR